MTLKTISRLCVAAALLVTLTTSNAKAGFGLLEKKGCDSACETCESCPNCSYKCKLEAKKGETEKSCYKVECDVICVPRVVFPWQKSCCDPCANNGACIKRVKKLKKEKYTCPKCEYKWTPEKTGCGTCGDGCCDTPGGCDNGSCDSGMIMSAPEPAVETILQPAGESTLETVPVEAVQPAPQSARRFWVPGKSF